jgi:hypothetical protein
LDVPTEQVMSVLPRSIEVRHSSVLVSFLEAESISSAPEPGAGPELGQEGKVGEKVARGAGAGN